MLNCSHEQINVNCAALRLQVGMEPPFQRFINYNILSNKKEPELDLYSTIYILIVSHFLSFECKAFDEIKECLISVGYTEDRDPIGTQQPNSLIMRSAR